MQNHFHKYDHSHTVSSERHNCLIKSALLNTCSIRDKIQLILELTSEHDLDLKFITETWIMPDDIPLISSLNTGPYSFFHLPRRNTHNYGGGIGIIYKSSFMYLLYVAIIMITLRRLPVPLVPHTPRLLIYHYYTDPPSSPIPLFLSEFYSFTHLMSESNIIIGDFNIATNLQRFSEGMLRKIFVTYQPIILNIYSIYCHPPILNFIILTPHTNMVIHSISSFPISHPT